MAKKLKFSEERMIDEIRGISLDMVNKANLEYSNMLISSAPFMYTLFKNNLVYDMDKPNSVEYVFDMRKVEKNLGYVSQYDYLSYLEDFKKEMYLQRFEKLWGHDLIEII